MILATADAENTYVLGDPKATLRPASAASQEPPRGEGNRGGGALAKVPLTDEEIEEYSRIKCCVCGERVSPEEVAEHSRQCVLEPAPNLRLQLDKWCIASASMTPAEQRAFLHMRRTEELAKVEEIEANLSRRMAQLWWMSGRFAFIISSRWLREWRSFVGVGRPSTSTRRDRPPSPINNMDLFDLDGSLRTGLQEGVQNDYHILEQPMWDFFLQVYGGGPAILRYNASGVPPAPGDQAATFEGDWRDLRPDSGCGRVFDPNSGCGFDGELRDGCLWTCTGKGLLRNGSHFEGRVSCGVADGEGREVLPDGTVLEGFFRRGLLHGRGRITDAMGRMEEGEWEDGVLLGI